MSERVLAQAQGYLPNVTLEVVSQGAEAVVFISDKHPYLPTDLKPMDIKCTEKYIIKFRPSKPYRHPKLDKQIKKSRTASEAKLLNKLYQLGVPAPKLIATDAPNGIIWMEFIGGSLENGNISSLKNWLWYLEEKQEQKDQTLSNKDSENLALNDYVEKIMFLVGEALGKLHLEDIVHGDLTSSNIILAEDSETGALSIPTLIDFGLSSYSNLAEDKAVDLYVLERALNSTHPVYSERYNELLLVGYESVHRKSGKIGMRKYVDIINRLEAVRMRGRKRSMLGQLNINFVYIFLVYNIININSLYAISQ